MPTNRPAITRTVVASSARTTSSNSGNLKDTTTDFAAMARTLTLHFQVTAYTVSGSKATGQARFYVDSSPDGGTTWMTTAIPIAVTTSTAERVITFRNGRPDGVNNIDGMLLAPVTPAGTTTAQLASLYPLAADKRIRWELGDGSAAGNGISCTFAVYASADPDQ